MIIERLREELREVNEKILNSRSIKSPTMEVLRGFIANQLYIVPHDLKALSTFMVKAGDLLEYEFVKNLIEGDYNAYRALLKLADELKVSFNYDALSPAAVAYTHFLSWLSLHGTMGDLAVAAAVNLPVWGENCGKLSAWARSVGVRNTDFMDFFSGPYTELEVMAERIAEKYLDWSKYRFISRAIQYYELMFWDSLA